VCVGGVGGWVGGGRGGGGGGEFMKKILLHRVQ